MIDKPNTCLIQTTPLLSFHGSIGGDIRKKENKSHALVKGDLVHNQASRTQAFVCDELCQLYDLMYNTRCPTIFHTEHHQSSFIGNFYVFCFWNENDDGFVVF